ncbi:unnamed protein product [Adineta steineri]|uniref:NAD(P)(+)--arginine ADP-ribosyltransferase n=1 Tax=Adineta steineri TaxID=433720 RepID=A0A815FBW7_9BILA|nr:unnamed protein product [Adineta steineri]CAF1350531.1 unnamed protein product [Adineta steineri]CAF3662194.1 unnamed protein product [Adineta steineri]CAF3664165.1 unnamed protein product [Adineta steineri]
MLNQALRTMNADIIINMGFFLCDVHQQIQQLHEQQVSSYGVKPFIVYRGQGLTESDFEKLQKAEGGLMSFNNFLSTSKDKEVSLEFAECTSLKPNMVGIFFVMSIDPCLKSTPFASIKKESYFKEEEEILFSMHTVFRVNAVKRVDNKNELYQVELQLTSDDDQQLRVLTDRIREEASGSTGWKRLAESFNDIGNVYDSMGKYSKALSYYEKGLQIWQKALPSNHTHLSTLYNNIGKAYTDMGEYSKALSCLEKALEIDKKKSSFKSS